jgi:hypothetical protein
MGCVRILWVQCLGAYEVYIGFEEDDWKAVWGDGGPTAET